MFIFLDADSKDVSSPRGNSEARNAKGDWAQYLEKEREGRKKVIQEILDMFAFTGRQLFEYILQEVFLVAFSEVVLVIKMLTSWRQFISNVWVCLTALFPHFSSPLLRRDCTYAGL